MQVAEVTAPLLLTKVPASVFVQITLLKAAVSIPQAQGKASAAFTGQYEPAGQSFGGPTETESVPSAQYFPVPQARGVVSPPAVVGH